MITEIVKQLGSGWVEVRKATLAPTSATQPEWEHQWGIYFIWTPDGVSRAESYLGEFIFCTKAETPTHGDTVQANRKVTECIKEAEKL